jgi:hypothetical protein
MNENSDKDKRSQIQWATRLSATENDQLLILGKLLYYRKKIDKLDKYHITRYALQWLLKFLDANKEQYFEELQKVTESN